MIECKLEMVQNCLDEIFLALTLFVNTTVFTKDSVLAMPGCICLDNGDSESMVREITNEEIKISKIKPINQS